MSGDTAYTARLVAIMYTRDVHDRHDKHDRYDRRKNKRVNTHVRHMHTNTPTHGTAAYSDTQQHTHTRIRKRTHAHTHTHTHPNINTYQHIQTHLRGHRRLPTLTGKARDTVGYCVPVGHRRTATCLPCPHGDLATETERATVNGSVTVSFTTVSVEDVIVQREHQITHSCVRVSVFVKTRLVRVVQIVHVDAHVSIWKTRTIIGCVQTVYVCTMQMTG